MEETSVYRRATTASFPTPGYGVWDGLQGTPMKKYMCPEDTTSGANYICTGGPEPGSWAATSYAANFFLFGTHFTASGATGPFPNSQSYASTYHMGTVPDGTSNTIAIVERSSSFPGNTTYGNAYAGGPAWGNYAPIYSWWPTPGSAPSTYPPQFDVPPAQADPNRCQGYHSSVIIVAMLDGSVRNVGAGVSATTWQSAILPSDGVPLGADW